MGWEADQMKMEAMDWAYDSTVCPFHRIRHLNDQPYIVCEDGEDFHDWKPHGRFRGVPS